MRATITFDAAAGRYEIDLGSPDARPTHRVELGDRVSAWVHDDGTVVAVVVDLPLDARTDAIDRADLALIGDALGAALSDALGRGADVVELGDLRLARAVETTRGALPAIARTPVAALGLLRPDAGLVRERPALVHADGTVSRGGEVVVPAHPDLERVVDLQTPAQVVWSEDTGQLDVRVALVAPADGAPTEIWVRISDRVDGRLLALAPLDADGRADTVLALAAPDLGAVYVDVTSAPLDPPGSAGARARVQAADLAEVAGRAEEAGDVRTAAAAWEAAAAVWSAIGDDALADTCRSYAARLRPGPPTGRRRRWWWLALVLLVAVALGVVAVVAIGSGGDDDDDTTSTTITSTTTTTAAAAATSARFVGAGTGAHVTVELATSEVPVEGAIDLELDISPTDDSGWMIREGVPPVAECEAAIGVEGGVEAIPFRRPFEVRFVLVPADQDGADDIAGYTSAMPFVATQLTTGEIGPATITGSHVETCSADPHPTKPGFLSAWWRQSYTPLTASIVVPPDVEPGSYRLAPLPIGGESWASGRPLEITVTPR